RGARVPEPHRRPRGRDPPRHPRRRHVGVGGRTRGNAGRSQHEPGGRPRGMDPDRRARRHECRPPGQGAVMRNDTDIAIVSWATTPMVRHTGDTETTLLLHAITDALEPIGLTRADVDFTCAGSDDYIPGATFAFVSNRDALGAGPPKRDSHVEMDGACALYEARLRLHYGDI